MLQSSDQTPAIAYALGSQEPIHTPGGGLSMPPLPPEAATNEAELDRFRHASARAQIILVDWFDRQAVYGVAAAFDIDRYERAVMALWRLTAIAKSIKALSADPNSPIPPTLEPELGSVTDVITTLEARASTPAEPPACDNATVSTSKEAQQPPSTVIPPTATHTALPSQTIPIAHAENPESTTPNLQSLASSTLSSLPSLSSLSVRAVPSCPTLSPERIATFLSRTEADLADSRPLHPLPPYNLNRPSNSNPQSKGESPVSLRDHNPQSCGPCVQCAEPHCAARIAVPVHNPQLRLKCDGACGYCDKTQTCLFTPARLRSRPLSPKAAPTPPPAKPPPSSP